MRIDVFQIGRRTNYNTPISFEEQNVLGHLYTDVWKYRTGKYKLFDISSNFNISRLVSKRRTDKIGDSKVITVFVTGVMYVIVRFFSKNTAQRMRSNLIFSRMIANGLGKKVVKPAEVCYCVQYGVEFFQKHPARFRVYELVECAGIYWPRRRKEIQKGMLKEDQISFLLEEAIVKAEQESMKASNLILCPSPFAVKYAKSVVGSRVQCALVPYSNSFSGTYTDKKQRKARIRVLFVGAVNLMKGVPDIYQALSFLDPEEYDAKLVGPVQMDLPYTSSSIEVTGLVDKATLKTYYEWADVFIFPSLSEGLPASLLEALLSGLPCIATEESGGVIRNGYNGMVVSRNSPREIADCIINIMQTKGLLRRLSRNARATGMEYLPSNVNEKRYLAVRKAYQSFIENS